MRIKRERSPTPPLSTRKLVTSGTRRITDVPSECKRGAPGFENARQVWARSEVRELRKLGLEQTRIYLRDDGLAIDWKSSVPVWSDTLLPEDHSEAGSASTSARAAGTPPRAQLAINDSEDELPQSASVHVSQEEVESWRNLANELEDAGLEYMQRYATAFDGNRAELAHAYTDDAIFSCSIHECNSPKASVDDEMIENFVPRRTIRNLLLKTTVRNVTVGRTAIASTLQQFGPHQLIPESVATPEVHYNVLYIASLQAVLLTCDGNLVAEDEKGIQRVSFSMAYLLRSSSQCGGRDNADLWPMVATSHQLVVRVKGPEHKKAQSA